METPPKKLKSRILLKIKKKIKKKTNQKIKLKKKQIEKSKKNLKKNTKKKQKNQILGCFLKILKIAKNPGFDFFDYFLIFF